MAIAVFNDDRVKFNEVVDAFRTDPMGGLADSLPNGEIGDTGRDQGHAFGQLMHLAAVAETAWKQGVDLYGARGNRLLKAAEYHSQYNLGGNPGFIRFGSGYGLYTSIGQDSAGARITPAAEGLDLIYTAYVVRKGLKAPFTTTLRAKAAVTYNSMIYRRLIDKSTATAPAGAWAAPAPSTPVTSLTSQDVGFVGAAGKTSFATGQWALTGSGGDPLSGYRFAYRTLTGDGTIVARVKTTGSASGSSAGLMLRSALNARDDSPYIMQRLLGNGSAQTYWSSHAKGNTWSYWSNFGAVPAPYWVKLSRRADYVYAYTSPDGKNWSPSASVLFANLPSTVYIGLAATSGNTSVLSTATFDHVAIGTGGSSRVVRPTGLTAKSASGIVTLRWKAAARAVSYTVLRATQSGGPYTVIATDVSGVSYRDKKAKKGLHYFYTVKAAGYAGLSRASLAVSATP
jgi:hypothetical protein